MLPDVQTFLKRYFTSAEVTEQTEQGNPMPCLLSAGFAYETPRKNTRPLPDTFFLRLNEEFSKLGKPLVAFSTSVVDNDVCVMEKTLFLDIVDQKVDDEEASIVVEFASTEHVNKIRKHVENQNEPPVR